MDDLHDAPRQRSEGRHGEHRPQEQKEVLEQWRGDSQGFWRAEGDRQVRGREAGEKKVVSSSVGQVPLASFAAAVFDVPGVPSVGREAHGWHDPRVHCRCVWHGFLLLHTLPIWPGCVALFCWQMLFLHSKDGAHPSAALHRWPLQPKTQGLSAGMYGFKGISVSGDKGVGGAGRYEVQLKLLRAVEARVSTSVRAVMEAYSGRSGLIIGVVDSFFEERCE